jgi:methylmalonyl-CoA/ethylmalonyl-CoA epimerase
MQTSDSANSGLSPTESEALSAFAGLEHIGIAVADGPSAVVRYSQLLGVGPYRTERVEREGVETVFFRVGNTKLELLIALTQTSPVAKFIATRGEGIHHLAFRVDDIRAEMVRLQAAGFRLLADEPKPGAEQKWVCFLHPKSANGVLVELTQDMTPSEIAAQSVGL